MSDAAKSSKGSKMRATGCARHGLALALALAAVCISGAEARRLLVWRLNCAGAWSGRCLNLLSRGLLSSASGPAAVHGLSFVRHQHVNSLGGGSGRVARAGVPRRPWPDLRAAAAAGAARRADQTAGRRRRRSGVAAAAAVLLPHVARRCLPAPSPPALHPPSSTPQRRRRVIP